MRDTIRTTIQRLWATERVGQLRELAISTWEKIKGVGADAWKRIKAGVSKPLGWLGHRWKDLKPLFVPDSQVAYVGLVLGTIALLFMVVGFLIRDDSYSDLGTVFFSVAVTLLITEQLAQKRQEKQEKQEKSDLIFLLGSNKPDVADVAVRKLRARGWLSDGTLKGAYLMGARLEGANLNHAHLQSANLIGANLEGANLAVAHLQGAYLNQAHLQSANLIGANLESANLIGANLEGANLMVASLERIVYDDDTIWPDGFTPPPSVKEQDSPRYGLPI